MAATRAYWKSIRLRLLHGGCAALFLFAGMARGATFYWNEHGTFTSTDFNRSYNWTSDADGDGSYPLSTTDEQFSAALGGSWTFKDQDGLVSPAATQSVGSGQLTISGEGEGVDATMTEITMIYRTDITGDFDVSVKFVSTTCPDWSKAGLIAADDLSNISGTAGEGLAIVANLNHATDLTDGAFFAGDTDLDGRIDPGEEQATAGNDAAKYLRLVKNGTTFQGYYKVNLSDTWTSLGSATVTDADADSDVGIFLNKGAGDGTLCNAVFDDFQGGTAISGTDNTFSMAGSGAGSNANATLTANITGAAFDIGDYTGTLNFGGFNMTLNSGNADFVPTSGSPTLTAAGTSTLTLTASTGTQILYPKASTTHPNIVHSGAGTVQLATNSLTCLSFSQSAGAFDFNSLNVTTTSSGNFTITNGGSSSFSNLAGRTITVAGATSFTGQVGNYLGLNPGSGWTIASTGALTATYATIANSNASVSAGTATSSTNSGGNSNWSFGLAGYSDWRYNQRILFNTTSTGANVSGNVSSFPVLLRFDSTNFVFEQAMHDGRDIRFEDPDGTILAYEIERWDPVNRKGEVWVKVPQVDGNSDKDNILMYWGNNSVAAASSGSGVFQTSNSFAGVWHLAEDATSTFQDATSNNYDGTGGNLENTDDEAALAGKGIRVDGVDEYIGFGTSAGSSADHTISFWAKADVLANQIPLDKHAATTAGWTFKFRSNGEIWYRTGGADGVTDVKDVTYGYRVGEWVHVTATFNATSDDAILYVNGVSAASNLSNTGSVNDATVALRIGVAASQGTTEKFDGVLDEVQISSAERSADWAKLTYQTQRLNTTAVTYENSALSNWAYSTKIYVNTTRTGAHVSGDLTNYPLLVRLDNGNFNFSQAKTGGEDIRFTDSTGVPLSYEIERWDATNKAADIWVLLPTVEGDNQAQWFKMYWGKASATSLSSSTSVFSSSNGFAGVWHLHNANYADATNLGNNGSNTATTTGTGVVAEGRTFDGSTTYINVGGGATGSSLHATSNLTLELWANASAKGANDKLLCKAYTSNTSPHIEYNLDMDGSADKYRFEIVTGVAPGTKTAVSTTTTPSTGTWYHLAATYDGSNMRIYLNGSEEAYAAKTGTITDHAMAVFIGRFEHAATQSFTGVLDEPRISTSTRSADWIRMNYETQRIGQRAVTIGPRRRDFTKSVQFNFNTTSSGADVSGNVANIPVLVRLTSSNFDFSAATATGADIQFVDKNGAYLYHEVVQWDPGNKLGKVWVKVPQVDGNSTADFITLHYGCSTCLSSPYAAADSVWSMYRSVFHLNGGDQQPNDVGALKNHGTPAANQAAAAGLTSQSALMFNGSSDYIAVPDESDYDFTNALTVSAWVKVTSFTTAYQSIVTKGDDEWRLMRNNSNNGAIFAVSVGGVKTVTNSTSLADGNWHYLTATFNGSQIRLLTDGLTESNTTAASGSLTNNNDPVWIGNNFDVSTRHWNGAISEVRVANTVLSDDFIKLSYKNQSSPDLLFATPITLSTSSFQKSKVFKFNTTSSGANVSGDVNNFPLLIRLTESAIIDNVQLSGAAPLDIRFLDGDGRTWLDYHAERWDQTNNLAEVWVKVPKVDGNSATDFITMYYQQASGVTVRDGSCKACVFDTANGFVGVWHLDEDGSSTAGAYKDATQNGYDGTGAAGMTNADDIAGPIGLGADFDAGATDYITAAGAKFPTGASKRTLSCWVDADVSSAADYTPVGYGSQAAGQMFAHMIYGADTWHLIDYNANLNSGTTADNNPHLLTATYDGTTVEYFLDGATDASGALTLTTTGTTMYFGARPTDAANRWDGVVDEVRISNVVRSSDWIKLEYETQRASPTLFLQSPSDFTSTRKYLLNTSVTGANVTNDVTDFPLLVRITEADLGGDFSTVLQSDCDDIRFMDDDGKTWLSYYVERCATFTNGSNNDTLDVWVKIPTVEGNSATQYITLYYNDVSGATVSSGQSAITAIFPTSTYKSIWTMNDNAASATVTDALGGFNGTLKRVATARNTSNNTAAGIIGKGLTFTDTQSDWVDLGTTSSILNSVGAASFTGWVRADALGTNDKDIIFISRNGSSTQARFTVRSASTSYLKTGGRSADTDGLQEVTATESVLSTSTWYHVAGVIDYANDEVKVYVNGTQVATSGTPAFSAATTSSSASNATALASRADGGAEFWGGTLDALTLTTTEMSGDFIKLSYHSQRPLSENVFFNRRPGPNNTATLTAAAEVGNIALSWPSAVTDSSNADSVGIWVKFKATGTAYAVSNYPDSARAAGAEVGGPTYVVTLPKTDTTYAYPATYPGTYYFALAVRNSNGKWSTFTASSRDTAVYHNSPGYNDTIYVDLATGSDANTCANARSPATPKLSTESAIACATVANVTDTLVIRAFPGAYTGADNENLDPPSTYPAVLTSFDGKSRAVMSSATTATYTVNLASDMNLRNLDIRAATNGADGVRFNSTTARVVIDGCRIYNNGAIIHQDCIDVPDINTGTMLFSNNVCVAPSQYGFNINADDKVNIINNVFHGSGGSTKGVYFSNGGAADVSFNITNNIFSNWSYGIHVTNDANSDLGLVSNNLFHLVTSGQEVSGETGSNSVIKDPLFYTTVLASPNAYKVLPGSPALEGGTSTVVASANTYDVYPSYDAFGAARTSGTRDIGIYEGSGHTPDASGEFDSLLTSSTATTLTVQNSKWRIVFDRDEGGGISQFYDKVSDPSCATNLVASGGLLFDVKIDAYQASTVAGNTIVPTFSEATGARATVRQRLAVDANTDLNVYYAIYPSGHIYVESEIQNLGTSTRTVGTLDYIMKLNSATATISGNTTASLDRGYGWLAATRDPYLAVTQELDAGASSETWNQATPANALSFKTSDLADIPKNMRRQHFFLLYIGETAMDARKAALMNADAFNPSVVTASAGSLLHERSWQDNLVGHWTLDEGDGTTARDHGVVHANHANLTSATWVTGKVGAGVSLTDASVGVISDAGVLEAGIGASYMFWVKPNFGAMEATALFLSKGTVSTDGWNFQRTSGASTVTFTMGSGSVTSTALASNEWSHLAAVVLGTRVIQMYVNGVLVASSTSEATATANASDVRIGENTDAGTLEFTGSMDDIRIYAEAVTEADVQAIYRRGFSEKYGHYHLRADNNNRVVALLNESAAQTRLQPAFQIDNWSAGATPKYVYLNGTRLTPNVDFFANYAIADGGYYGNYLILQINKTLTGGSQTLFVDDDDSTGYMGEAAKMKSLAITHAAGDKIAIRNFADTVFGSAASGEWAVELDLDGWTSNTAIRVVDTGFGEFNSWKAAAVSPSLAISGATELAGLHGQAGRSIAGMKFDEDVTTDMFSGGTGYAGPADIVPTIVDSSSTRLSLTLSSMTITGTLGTLTLAKRWTVYPTGRIFGSFTISGSNASLDNNVRVHLQGRYNLASADASGQGLAQTWAGATADANGRYGIYQGNLDYHSIVGGILSLKSATTTYKIAAQAADIMGTTPALLASNTGGADYHIARLTLDNTKFESADDDTEPIVVNFVVDISEDFTDPNVGDSLIKDIQNPATITQITGSANPTDALDFGTADGFAEGDGAYVYQASSGVAHFKFANTYKCFYPAFRIKNWTVGTLPEYVIVNNQTLTLGYGYNAYLNAAGDELIMQVNKTFVPGTHVFFISHKTGLAVTLDSFEAVSGEGVDTLRWTTQSEFENLGFHVWRRAAPVQEVLDSAALAAVAANRKYGAGVTAAMRKALAAQSARSGALAKPAQAGPADPSDTVPRLALTREELAALGYVRITPKLIPGAKGGASATTQAYQLIDRTASFDVTYDYVLEAVDFNGERQLFGPRSARPINPLQTELLANYPNPFNPVTTLRFSLRDKARVSLVIFDAKGRAVRTLIRPDKPMSPGRYRLLWDARDDRGLEAPSGQYFYRFAVPGYLKTRKMILVK